MFDKPTAYGCQNNFLVFNYALVSVKMKKSGGIGAITDAKFI